MPNIERRQVVNIVQDLTGNTQNFNQAVKVDFIPEEAIVRQLTYNTTEAVSIRVYRLYSNLLDDQIIALFPAGVTNVSLDTRFNISKAVNGSFNFQVQEANGTVSANAIGQLSVLIEFIKYKKKN